MAKRIDVDRKATLMEPLVRRRRAGLELTSAAIREVCSSLGVSRATVWRWLEAGGDAHAVAVEPLMQGEALDLFFQFNGSVAAAHRELVRLHGCQAPSLRRLQRAARRDLTPADRAYAKDGIAGRRRHQLHLTWHAESRNAIWEADHKELSVFVLPPRGTRPVKPWVTWFIDCHDRAIRGWALNLRPSQADVLAALRSAVLGDDRRGPFRGLPELIRWDNGLEFLARPVTHAAASLGVLAIPVQAHAPHLKGKIERVNRTVDQELLQTLPFFTGGAKRANGKLYGPSCDPMSLDHFTQLFSDWVDDYNLIRPHSALGGQTPREVFEADPAPLRLMDADQLRWMMLGRKSRKVLRDGIHFNRLIYFAPELNGHIGAHVDVGYMPHDARSIDVFIGEQHLCTCRPVNALSDEERHRFIQRRKEEAKGAEKARRRATYRSRARLAPITSPDAPIEEVTHVDRETAEASVGVATGERIPAAKNTDLLGVDGLWEPIPATLVTEISEESA